MLVPLQFENVPELKVLDSLLRSAAGIIVAPRTARTSSASAFEIVQILATSTATATGSFAPVNMPPPPTSGAPSDEIPPVTPVNQAQRGAGRTPNRPAAPPPPSVGVPASSVFVPIQPVPAAAGPWDEAARRRRRLHLRRREAPGLKALAGVESTRRYVDATGPRNELTLAIFPSRRKMASVLVHGTCMHPAYDMSVSGLLPVRPCRMPSMTVSRSGSAERGDYHRDFSPDWECLPDLSREARTRPHTSHESASRRPRARRRMWRRRLGRRIPQPAGNRGHRSELQLGPRAPRIAHGAAVCRRSSITRCASTSSSTSRSTIRNARSRSFFGW